MKLLMTMTMALLKLYRHLLTKLLMKIIRIRKRCLRRSPTRMLGPDYRLLSFTIWSLFWGCLLGFLWRGLYHFGLSWARVFWLNGSISTFSTILVSPTPTALVCSSDPDVVVLDSHDDPGHCSVLLGGTSPNPSPRSLSETPNHSASLPGNLDDIHRLLDGWIACLPRTHPWIFGSPPVHHAGIRIQEKYCCLQTYPGPWRPGRVQPWNTSAVSSTEVTSRLWHNRCTRSETIGTTDIDHRARPLLWCLRWASQRACERFLWLHRWRHFWFHFGARIMPSIKLYWLTVLAKMQRKSSRKTKVIWSMDQQRFREDCRMQHSNFWRLTRTLWYLLEGVTDTQSYSTQEHRWESRTIKSTLTDLSQFLKVTWDGGHGARTQDWRSWTFHMDLSQFRWKRTEDTVSVLLCTLRQGATAESTMSV